MIMRYDNAQILLDAFNTCECCNRHQVNRPAIVKDIGNIYKSEELSKDLTCSILEQVALDGKKRKINY